MSSRADTLGTVSIFGGLSDEGIRFLDERLTAVEVASGGAFFAQGDVGDSVFVLDRGHAEVVKSHAGRNLVLANLEAGACFGEIALIAICPRTATVRAVTDCRALRLTNRVLLELYHRHPEQFTLVQMNLGREIARRLSALEDLVVEVATSGSPANESGLARRLGDTLK